MELSTELAAALEHGARVIMRARLVLDRCEATRAKTQRLARDFVLARPYKASRLIRGASDVGHGQPPREVWLHRPTGRHWIVVTDTSGVPVSAVGPFHATEWDAVLRDYVPVDGHHGLAWLHEHIDEFVRGGDGGHADAPNERP
jgi:hypothetical protein